MGTKVGPRDAYAFAQGSSISLTDDQEQQTRSARLDRPLDFAAITDHSEFFGEVNLCTTPGSLIYDEKICQELRQADDPNDRFNVTVDWLFPVGIDNPPPSLPICNTKATAAARQSRYGRKCRPRRRPTTTAARRARSPRSSAMSTPRARAGGISTAT
jgi:hypothetical protein